GMANFLSDVVQYQARVYAYSYMLLTDQYPPFALANSDYAVSVATHPGQLNRAAVFFRPILLVPAGIMTFLVGVGMQIAMIVGWIITLILGRLPTPLWEANAAVLRYATRFQAFAFMLTAEQPKALWGDPPAPVVAEASLGEPDLPERPRITRLVLSKAARRVLVTFIVLTIVVYGGLIVVGGVTGVKTARAYRQLDDSHHSLGVAVNQFGADAQQCAISGGLTCLHDANTRLANAFDGFATEVGNISFPAQLDASPLIADAHDCSAALRRMAVASTQTDYGAAAADYQSALNRFNQDYSDFAYNADNAN
ncbi:MAG TPA: DUF4389 domain-containing protein, partial [Acidimicrobiales bacterium]|nr:DUF4389 domain-containing protein [Acidimicrobiales bacterium]